MDQQIQNIRRNPEELGTLLKEKTKQQVLELIGHSNYNSNFDIWQYDLIKNWFFLREMILFFTKDEYLLDIDIHDYLFGIRIKERFY